ncbi:MAG: hypothetical protein PWQ06_329 [Anaerophaga sp.]|nr:hypothetical protein [Anaerophaga sp.]
MYRGRSCLTDYPLICGKLRKALRNNKVQYIYFVQIILHLINKCGIKRHIFVKIKTFYLLCRS